MPKTSDIPSVHTLARQGFFDQYYSKPLLGRGGSSDVRLLHSSLERYAVKIFSDANAEQFKRECEAYRKFRHAHIVDCIGSYTNEMASFIVLTYAELGTVQDFIKKSTHSISWGAMGYRWAFGVASALTFIHEQDHIHRDIKPSNLLIFGDDIKLCDFGLTCKIDEPVDLGWGTFRYISPEQARQEGITTQSDMFSFGSVLYFMQTGKYRYIELNAAEYFHKLVEGAPHEIPIDTPASIQYMIERCWQFHPNDRPTAKKVKDELASHFGNELPAP